MVSQPTLINSVIRALHLLDALGAAGSPQPAKKLARTVDVPLPTVYHLLRTLVHEGYAVRTPEGYTLGDQAMALGDGVENTRVREVLRQLHTDVHAAAYLASFEDGDIRITEIADSPAAQRIDLWVGFAEAAHATALGKAILKALTLDERHDYVTAHRLADLTPHTITSPRLLLKELEAPGNIALDHEEYALGVVCIAVPVPGRDQAVAVSVPTHREGELLDRVGELRRAAHLIALAQG